MCVMCTAAEEAVRVAIAERDDARLFADGDALLAWLESPDDEIEGAS